MYNTRIGTFLFALFMVFATTLHARVHHIEPGEGRISAILSSLAPNDTLMLASNGVYHETGSVALPPFPLTLMANPVGDVSPVWTTDFHRHIEVYHQLTVHGIHFNGRNQTHSAIRIQTPSDQTLIVETCRFSDFLQDAITEIQGAIGPVIVRNSIFHDIAQTAIEFKTPDRCPALTVENSTFYNIGERAIHVVAIATPITVELNHLTINNCIGGIMLEKIAAVQISNSIITNCWSYGIRVLPDTNTATLTHNCLFNNKRNFGEREKPPTCIEADPLCFDPLVGDFSLRSNSPCITAGPGGTPIGDLRWTGRATVIADRWHFTRTWMPVLGMAFAIAVFTFGGYRIANWRIRERAEHQALEETRSELEMHVAERTAELRASNIKLQREVAERLRAEDALRDAQDLLERRVAERTRELQTANEQLHAEIAAHWQTEQTLQERDEQLRQSQKLEAIGQLAGGIAHDFNNQLAIIRGYVDMVREKINAEPRLHRQLNHISEAVDRSARLTHQLLIFSSKQPIEARPLNLNQNIQNIQHMLERLLGEDIDVQLEMEPDLRVLVADSGNIDQVLTNLGVNARDAMPNGGVLTICTRNAALENQASGVCISVTDTGVGMDDEIQSRLFEPFFSTKAPGKGTGLGLSVVYGIVQAHGGQIDIDSAPGKGSTFHIYLPAQDAIASAETSKPEIEVPNKQQGKQERILFVEDEPALREMKRQMLEAANYDVVACGSITEALKAVDRADIPFDLLLSDVVLPDGRGTDLAVKLTHDRPDLPVVLETGYTDERADWDRARERGWPLLQKPVSANRIQEVIRYALDNPPKASTG